MRVVLLALVAAFAINTSSTAALNQACYSDCTDNKLSCDASLVGDKFCQTYVKTIKSLCELKCQTTGGGSGGPPWKSNPDPWLFDCENNPSSFYCTAD